MSAVVKNMDRAMQDMNLERVTSPLNSFISSLPRLTLVRNHENLDLSSDG